MSLKLINKNIKMITATGLELDKLVHETGILCLFHAAEHGDVRPMDNLLNALNAGYRVQGFKVWAQKFSPIRWNGDGKIGLLKPDAKTFTPFDTEGATANPFWTLAEAKEITVKELSPAALKAMIERFIKYVDEADANGEIHNKGGVLVKRVVGGVVEMKDYANRLKAVPEAILVAEAVAA